MSPARVPIPGRGGRGGPGLLSTLLAVALALVVVAGLIAYVKR